MAQNSLLVTNLVDIFISSNTYGYPHAMHLVSLTWEPKDEKKKKLLTVGARYIP